MRRATVPTYEQLCKEFGFRVPRSYHHLLELGARLSPKDPFNAFDRLHLRQLDHRGPTACSYTAPPDFMIFGWSGSDSGHYGFVLDGLDEDVDERPVAQNYPDGAETRLLAMTFPDFLGLLCAPADEDDEPDPDDPWQQDVDRLAAVLKKELGVRVPKSQTRASDRAWKKRLASGATPTQDRIGVMVPPDTVDRRYLDSLVWNVPGGFAWEKPDPDPRRLDDAERRLERGEVGTALVVARDFRFHHWYADWQGDRAYIKRTSSILQRAYAALGREYAAKAVRRQTREALKDVV